MFNENFILDFEFDEIQLFVQTIAHPQEKIDIGGTLSSTQEFQDFLKRQVKNYGKIIIKLYEITKDLISYKEDDMSNKGTLTIYDLLQKINEKMEKYERKICSLQKKNAEYQLKYKIHECEVSFNDLLEKSDIYPKIRGLFENGSYLEGVEMLKNANYQKNNKVSYEEMLNWLAISNRMKDLKLDDLHTKCIHFDSYSEKNKENLKNENLREKDQDKKNKHMVISNQISSLMMENQTLKKQIENFKERTEEKNSENYSKIVHQQIDNMKWGYIEQIKQFEKKVDELQKEKEEFLLIIQELDRLVNKQKERIGKNDEKFSNLKKYSLHQEKVINEISRKK